MLLFNLLTGTLSLPCLLFAAIMPLIISISLNMRVYAKRNTSGMLLGPKMILSSERKALATHKSVQEIFQGKEVASNNAVQKLIMSFRFSTKKFTASSLTKLLAS